MPPALLSDPQLDDDELCSVEADRMQFVDLFPGGAEGTENFMRGLVKTGVTGELARTTGPLRATSAWSCRAAGNAHSLAFLEDALPVSLSTNISAAPALGCCTSRRSDVPGSQH